MIRLENIIKKYGEKTVLNNITLDIKKGEIFGLIGKNGAGKTTLLSILAGLIHSTDGECYINEDAMESEKRRLEVGYLPDVPAFFDFMKVGEFIDFLGRGVLDKTKREELLRLGKMDEKTVINTMSRGMRQRLGLVAVLISNPDILLLDEPSSALDPEGRSELLDILFQLKEQGKTIILSTHILAEMEKVCDRVGFLHNGTIVKTVCTKQEKRNVKFVFEKPIHNVWSPDIALLQEESRSIVFTEEFYDGEIQKKILKEMLEMNNTIVNIGVIGTDLEREFREICV